MLEEILNPYSPFFWILVISIILLVVIIMSRPFSTYIKFVYPNAKFEAIGNPFIHEKELNNIVEAKDLLSFKESLNGMKDYEIIGEDTYSIQKSLDDNFLNTIKMMRKDSSKKLYDFFETYLEKVDLYLIKNEVKKIVLDIPHSNNVDYAILTRTKQILSEIKESEKEKLLDLLQKYDYNKDILNSISKEKPDVLEIDMVFDRYIINKLKHVKVPYKCEQTKQSYLNYIIDIANIKNILRAKNLDYNKDSCITLFLGEGQEIAEWKFNELVELEKPSQIISSLEGTSYFNILKDAIEDYNKEGSVQVFELSLDGYFLKIVKDVSIQNYLNLGPTIRYLASKEIEIRNLKIITKGIGEKIQSKIIKNYLIKEVAQ